MIKLAGQKSTKKQALFKIFIYVMIEVMCFNLYVITSGLEGNFNWTIELLTTTAAGMTIQVIILVSSIVGFILIIQIIIYILLIFTGSD